MWNSELECRRARIDLRICRQTVGSRGVRDQISTHPTQPLHHHNVLTQAESITPRLAQCCPYGHPGWAASRHSTASTSLVQTPSKHARATLALTLAAAPVSGAKRSRRPPPPGRAADKHGKPYPETKAECGVVMFGTGDDYIQYSARNAQRIAALAPGKNWCAAQPDLDHIPVVYFHDNTEAEALVRKGLGGAEPRFELFYLGTRANPTMAKFEALPTQRRWARDYKWLRPQYYKRSPFSITLGMDGDAVPCGARLVEAFRLCEVKAAVAASGTSARRTRASTLVHGVGQGELRRHRGVAAVCERHPGEPDHQARPAVALRGAERDARRVRPALLGGERLPRLPQGCEFRLRVDVRVGRLLGRPPRLGPELQQGRHRRHRQGGRRHQGVEEVESAPRLTLTVYILHPVVASLVSPSAHRGVFGAALPTATVGLMRASLVFGRTDVPHLA